MLLVGVDVPEAARVGERLLQGVRSLSVEAVGGQRVTVSAGLARLDETESLAEAQRRADAALYAAKTRGRDRMAMAG